MKQFRLLSTLLAFILCTALQAETVSGKCGDNLTWTLNTETGVLKIEGSGKMNDYSSSPWYSYRDKILTLELSDELSNIGMRAFEDCSSLTAVTIPNSVTKIEAFAFRGCSGLTSISIPNSVTDISGQAFVGCTK